MTAQANSTAIPVANPLPAHPLRALSTFVQSHMQASQLSLLMWFVAATSVLEILAFSLHSIFEVLAARWWLLCALITAGYVLLAAGRAVRKDIAQRSWLPLLGLAILFIPLLGVLGNVQLTEICPDATQQAADGMAAFSQPAWNYTGKAFIGYPSRQFLIVALPGTLFGASIFNLQLGFFLPLLLGLAACYAGVRRWCEQIDSRLAILPIAVLPAFGYLVEYYLIFEQTIFPIAYTLLATGCLLLLLADFSLLGAIALFWVGGMLCNSYTPALASLGLLLAAYVYLWMQPLPWSPTPLAKKPLRQALLALCTGTLAFAACTVLSGRGDRVSEVRPEVSASQVLVDIAAFLSDHNAAFFGAMLLPVLAYLALALALRLGRGHLLVALWSLGVIVATMSLKGYTTYEVACIMQRAMIILPVLMVAMTLALAHWLSRRQLHISNGALLAVIVVSMLLGWANMAQDQRYFKYMNAIRPAKFILADAQATLRQLHIPASSEFDLVVVTRNGLLSNFADYTRYLFPAAHAKVIGADAPLPAGQGESRPLLVYADEGLAHSVPGLAMEAFPGHDRRVDQRFILYRAVLCGTCGQAKP